jgi:2-dehydro-3-deoxygluconokinase
MTSVPPARVLTVGETMALLDPTTDGEIESRMQFSLRVAGAETNFAIAMTRLGIPVTWVSRLGDDPFGDVVYKTLATEGIDLSYVHRDDSPTGLFFKWRTASSSHVIYRRRGSAASHIEPSDVPDPAFDGAALVHLTGITMALGASARATVVDVARRAHARGIPVTFDPNYRPALWSDPDEAAAAQRSVLGFVEWYLCGLDEGCRLWRATDADSLFAGLESAGVARAVVRIGSEGVLVNDSRAVTHVAPERLEEVIDEVGAGDGFAAGFAYGLINGWAPTDCARAGNLIAAHALLGTGDWETFPYLADVEHFLRPRGSPHGATRKGDMRR